MFRGREAIAPEEKMNNRTLLAGTITVAVAAVGAWWLFGQRSAEPSAPGTLREATVVEAQQSRPATRSATDRLPESATTAPPTEATALPELVEIPVQSTPPVGDELLTLPNDSAPGVSGQPELELLPQPPPVTPSPDELDELREAAPSGQGKTSTR